MYRGYLAAVSRYALAFARWTPAALAVGLACGIAGAAFSLAVGYVNQVRVGCGWLLYLLPIGGVAVAGIYHLAKMPVSMGTDEIIESVRTQKKVPIAMAPVIFVSTVITHLLGGSAGREGAALQLGGSIGAFMGDHVKPHHDDRRIFELCGMAALFSALFGTPFTAALFVLEVVDVGRFNYRALMPCAISSVTAALVAKFMGARGEAFALASGMAKFAVPDLLRVTALAALCAIVAIVFCECMHMSSRYIKKLIRNDYLRSALGGCAVIALTLIIGNRDYNGGGMDVVARAMAGDAVPYAFALKILLTAVTLGSGFKGGEIVPSFFVGSTFGCAAAGLLGLNPALGAALGLAAVFCGVTNTPVASLVLSVELFGAEYFPLFGLAVSVSFMLSGSVSLYHSQHFAQPKLGQDDVD